MASSSRTSAALAAALALVVAAAAPACNGSKSSAVALPPQFNLTSSGALPPNSAIYSLAFLGERQGLALMNSSGAPRTEVVIPFDPETGALGPSATARVAVTFSPPLPNRAGQPVATTLTSFPAFATAEAGKLYVTTSNLNDQFVLNPGTVLVYDYDYARNRIGGLRRAIPMTASAEVFYNPNAIVRFQRPGEGPKLAVVCSDDPFLFGPTPSAAVLVVDPATDAVVEVAKLGAAQASTGPAALGPDLRLYVGSSVLSELYVVNLATSPPSVERGAANPVTLTSASAFTNQVAALELSDDAKRLYAINGNDGGLTVLSLAAPASPAPLTRTAVFKRSTPGDAFKNMPLALAVRPGRPGIDFTGPDAVVGTILIPAADQVVTSVRTAVDAVTTYTTPVAVSLDAVVSPFTPFTDIQQIVAPRFPNLSGSFYAVEGVTGKVVVRRFGDLR